MSLSRNKLSPAALSEQLQSLEGWTLNGDGKIEKHYQFGRFLTAIDFINGIAQHAEALDHHPELFNVYDRVEIQLVTHDADGVTAYDLALAKRCDEVASAL